MERGGETAVEKGAQNKNTGRRNRTEPVELESNNELWVAVSLRTQALIVWTAGVAVRDGMGGERERKKNPAARSQINGSWLQSAVGGWVGGGGLAPVA